MHALQNHPTLLPSLGEDIDDNMLDRLQKTKERIEDEQKQGNTVAVVHLSGDMMHSGHIQYMNTIKAKLQHKLPGTNIKLLVGVESDSRTMQRKQKENIDPQDERVYKFENLDVVDKAYIEFEGVTGPGENEERPAGIIKYLAPDIVVSHQEHVNTFSDYLGMYRRMRKNNLAKVMVINYNDEHKYIGEESVDYTTPNTQEKQPKAFCGRRAIETILGEAWD